MKGVVGPVSPDTAFYDAINGKFDAVIALYHDQGLIPFKMLHFMDGVNLTLGLPFIRTSPDHGTAFDIAGKGIANPVGAIWAGAMMLDHLGERAAHDRIVAAIGRVFEEGTIKTPDLGGTATTAQVGKAIAQAVTEGSRQPSSA